MLVVRAVAKELLKKNKIHIAGRIRKCRQINESFGIVQCKLKGWTGYCDGGTVCMKRPRACTCVVPCHTKLSCVVIAQVRQLQEEFPLLSLYGEGIALLSKKLSQVRPTPFLVSYVCS